MSFAARLAAAVAVAVLLHTLANVPNCECCSGEHDAYVAQLAELNAHAAHPMRDIDDAAAHFDALGDMYYASFALVSCQAEHPNGCRCRRRLAEAQYALLRLDALNAHACAVYARALREADATQLVVTVAYLTAAGAVLPDACVETGNGSDVYGILPVVTGDGSDTQPAQWPPRARSYL